MELDQGDPQEGAEGTPSTDYDDGQVGVYLHLPFCDRVCPYCDFAVVAARPLSEEMEARTVAGLLAELGARRADFAGRSLASVYFGGGTPSLFHPKSIEALIHGVHEAFGETPGLDSSIETTLELNPSTVEQERLPGFREAGVNRLSIGIQSFDDRQLKRLGRAHRASVARSTLSAARAAGFDNLSVDLIFAGPEQSQADLERDLAEVIEWSPEHVSTYELTFEPETPFGRALASGRMRAPDEDHAAEMIVQIEARLEADAFERYEISSYAKPGRRAQHNARYWQRQAVLGLGMGAHSTEARSSVHPHGARRANPRQLADWFALVEANPPQVDRLEIEPLPAATARGEAVFLALRTREGLDARAFKAEFGGAPRHFFSDEINELLDREWLAEKPSGDLSLTAAGKMLADQVAAEFVSAQPDS